MGANKHPTSKCNLTINKAAIQPPCCIFAEQPYPFNAMIETDQFYWNNLPCRWMEISKPNL